ncbi:T9SS type B sorting domain-containing protein [Maribacter confluentis]|uniref:T9SS type B sorting domain-containing protein n=1 Tax=Maribacter confluentis TaxID=1656093 RepID=A0ABT8RNC5_9FLAO|nr:T9SS type B sorting domain-containing protein [Maribacter confluentis]MDO1512408.1 T9SS type B sorting domain-containing protein [Maribacter confluentis]
MLKSFPIIVFILFYNVISAQITLTHNIGNTPIKTNMTSCQYEESWSRAFTLSDFGISTADQFIITSGQVAISNSYEGARLIFNFYSLNSEAPEYNPQRISYGNLVLAPEIGDTPEIVQIEFASPITIPAGVERILVEVTQMDDIYNDAYKKVSIAGTEFDNDTSWYRGCRVYYTHIATENLIPAVPDANFFINVTGYKITPSNLGSITTLTNNPCGDPIKTSMFSCSYSKLFWARLFTLEDFGISTNEELTINLGQIGITSSDGGTGIQFNIYEVDENFPDSFSETNLIGSSQVQRLPYVSDYYPQIITVNFETPITVPSNVTRILVEVTNVISWGSGVFFVAGTEQDVGDSWYRGCGSGSPGYSMEDYVSMVDPAFRKLGGYPDAKFYINVTGNVNHVTNDFSMNISNICSDFLKEFSVTPTDNMTSIAWDFGDPASGVENSSTNFSPFHDFSADGTYTITATVTATDGSIEILTETIDVKEPPNAYGIDDIYACEDSYNTGVSSSFNVGQVTQQVLGGQNNMTVTFIDGSGNSYTSLPNPFTNSINNRETITVRVAHNNAPCCYSETSFDLIVNPIPDLSSVTDLIVCSNETDGFATFDLEQVQQAILSGNNINSVAFYRENGNQIQAPLDSVENQTINEEVITVKAYENVNNCYNETTFKLMVNPLPIAHDLDILIGCDDNGDGISEYFDTSMVESQVLNNQMNLTVSYFDANGNSLPSPLNNPYTNTIAGEETITVRVTNTQTSCYGETPLVLRTSTRPQLNMPSTVYACDLGNGFANFDLSHIEEEIIGSQTGLNLFYFDANGVELGSPLTASYKNSIPWNETITVRAENVLNASCYEETSFNLIVNELPTTTLEKSYYLCHLEPSLSIEVESGFDYYSWSHENEGAISNTHEVDLVHAGNYTLTIGKRTNDEYCENSFEFELIRSTPPTITEVRYKDLSDNDFIEILASGDGDFEYSLDGVNFQDSNYFSDAIGGTYTVMVRDKEGCGQDSADVILIDYPKFFTPNNDGNNDYWQIFGIDQYPDAYVHIYDQYGKLLAQLTPNDLGWDGLFNGKEMPTNDYWFKINLQNGTIFSAHFTLKR